MLPYSRTHFCELYGAFAATLRRSMRQEHKAGEKPLVDYAGQTVAVIDAATGEIRDASVFVAVWALRGIDLDNLVMVDASRG